jgi:predicted nuclease of predicted toxin-antitoxin system
MKVLLDTCVWYGVRDALVAAGEDIVWSGDWAEDPGDEQILSIAHREGRILVTLDKDFGELAILKRQLHSGILRLVNSVQSNRLRCVPMYLLDISKN